MGGEREREREGIGDQTILYGLGKVNARGRGKRKEKELVGRIERMEKDCEGNEKNTWRMRWEMGEI